MNMKINQKRRQIIISLLGMNGNELQERLEIIGQSVIMNKNQFIMDNPSWKVQTDARITSLGKLINYIEVTRLSIQFLSELFDDDWFDHHSPSSQPELRDTLAMIYENKVKYEFGMDFFTGIEASFRIFLRAIDPIACGNGSEPFINIYGSLLGDKHLNFQNNERKAAIELLNLSRLIRNLIHNGGVFFSQKGVDESTRYKGKVYKFEHEKPVKFAYWELLLDLAAEIQKLLVTVINHPDIASIPYIHDPYHSA